jgi:hypothetical protein
MSEPKKGTSLKPEDFVGIIRERFPDDPKLWPHYLTGAWDGYFGGVEDRVVTNLTGGFADPLLALQLARDGRVGIGMITSRGIGISGSEFPDPLDVFEEDENGNLEYTLKDLMDAAVEGKKLGLELREEFPYDGSVNVHELSTKIIELREEDAPYNIRRRVH